MSPACTVQFGPVPNLHLMIDKGMEATKIGGFANPDAPNDKKEESRASEKDKVNNPDAHEAKKVQIWASGKAKPSNPDAARKIGYILR